MTPEIYIGLPDMAKYKFKNDLLDIDGATPGFIIKQVSQVFKVSIEEITGKSQKRIYVVPRQISMYLIRKNTTLSLKSIGDLFSNRDHSTVINSCTLVQDLYGLDKPFTEQMNKVIKSINQCN